MNAAGELDGETYYRLKTLIETVTHSGLRVLDEKLFKEIKKICRISPAATEKTYSLILYQLKKNHSEIRYLAFQMCLELFKRSALFRELVVNDLQLIFELTAETNPKKKLPEPKTVAQILERLALSTIKKWNDEFGTSFRQLQIAFQYLKHLKKVNFETLTANEEMQMQREKNERSMKKEKMEKLIQEIDSYEQEIRNAVTELNNCMSLLVPSLDDFFIHGDNKDECSLISKGNKTDSVQSLNQESENGSTDINLREFGITSNYGIVVKGDTCNGTILVQRTEENVAVIQNAEDNVKLIKNRYLPLVKKWNQICVKYAQDNGSTIQRILKLKEDVENCLNKYRDLNICSSCIDESDSSDDFVEVTKEHFEPSVLVMDNFDIPSTSGVGAKKLTSEWKISVGEEGDPTSALSTLKKLQSKDDSRSDGTESEGKTEGIPTSHLSGAPSTSKSELSRKDKLLACAPKIPYDIDLYHWEDQHLKAPTLLSIKMDNPKFWGATSVDDMDEIPNPDGVAALRTRMIEFSGKFEPVKWSCRAPLPNGKLCPRRDRYKCPFHGKIVARDENGVVQDGGATKSESGGGKRKSDCDWQDPELLKDLKNATGIDLKMPSKKIRSDKKTCNKTNKAMKTSSTSMHEIDKRNFPGLTDTIGKKNTAYKRISKKIFKKGALKKVATTLDKIDFARHRDKFGDQFNYVYGT